MTKYANLVKNPDLAEAMIIKLENQVIKLKKQLDKKPEHDQNLINDLNEEIEDLKNQMKKMRNIEFSDLELTTSKRIIKDLKRSINSHKGNYTRLKTKYEQSKIQVTQLQKAREEDKLLLDRKTDWLIRKTKDQGIASIMISNYSNRITRELRDKAALISGFVIMTGIVIATNFF